MEIGQKILQQISADEQAAEEYLLRGLSDGSPYAQAVAIVEKHAGRSERCLILARRKVEMEKRNRNKRWVVKTQFAFESIAEAHGLPVPWISEQKIKRDWKKLIYLTSEIAVRIRLAGAK
jgi:hypothetical protein